MQPALSAQIPDATPEGPSSPPERRLPPSRLLGIGGAVVVSLLGIWAAASYSHEPPPLPHPPPGLKVEGSANVSLSPDAPQWKVLRLGNAALAAGRYTDPIPARVKIDETKAARIGAPLSGRVTAVLVELGQPVKAKDKLFSVASADIADMRADRMKAEVDMQVAKTALDRVKALVAAQALPAKDEIAAEQQYKQAELSMRLADSKISSLKVSAKADNEFTVTSPRDGFVVEKRVLPAQQVSRDADQALITIADLSSVWVVADLFEADAVGIKPGTSVKVTFPSMPGTTIDGKVDTVSSVVDPDKHTVPVRVVLDNAERALRPNIFAQMRLAIDPRPDLVEVAASAIVSDGAHQYVYVQETSGHFARRSVVAGSAHESVVTVSLGLKPGEVVVEDGAILLDNQIELSN